MAEQAINSIIGAMGSSPVLNQLQNDEAFGPGKTNWKNRRRMIIGIIIVSYTCCVLEFIIWAVMALMHGKTDMQPNILNFGTTIFWAFLVTSTSLLMTYIGVSQADTQSYRREMSGLAKSLPPPPPPTIIQSVDPSQVQPGYGGGFTEPAPTLQPGQGGSVTNNIVIGGPTTRKPGVII